MTRRISYSLDVWDVPENVSVWFVKNKPVNVAVTNITGNMSSSGQYKTMRRAERTMRYLLETYPGIVVEITRWMYKDGKRLAKSFCYCRDHYKLGKFMDEWRR